GWVWYVGAVVVTIALALSVPVDAVFEPETNGQLPAEALFLMLALLVPGALMAFRGLHLIARSRHQKA
ncbi:MAG: hypothetical protein AAF638_13650, partial [Pseudomonadota bacterium]